ncbi:MAG: pyrroline-5-carboxylate reductase [Verrucomicrobia bacterium]|nr:pyrroline-5-carboxylate reductase [Verrucomicrobiota bacterium]
MKLAFLGAGRMAAAIARGALDAHLCTPAEIRATARTEPTRAAFAKTVGLKDHAAEAAIQPATENAQIAAAAEIVFLCVKPLDLLPVAREIAPHLRADNQLLVSVAAGISLADLQKAVGDAVPLVRVMPNTPALVGQGACAYARGATTTDHHTGLVEKIFGALGEIHAIDEKLIDAVNGLSASGPAYVFTVIEALADGGVLMGLPRVLAASLATQTVLGAAALVKETGHHPAQLRDAVASAGGTTMAGLEALEAGGLRAALIAAVRAGTVRARGLGAGLPP